MGLYWDGHFLNLLLKPDQVQWKVLNSAHFLFKLTSIGIYFDFSNDVEQRIRTWNRSVRSSTEPPTLSSFLMLLLFFRPLGCCLWCCCCCYCYRCCCCCCYRCCCPFCFEAGVCCCQSDKLSRFFSSGANWTAKNFPLLAKKEKKNPKLSFSFGS